MKETKLMTHGTPAVIESALLEKDTVCTAYKNVLVAGLPKLLAKTLFDKVTTRSVTGEIDEKLFLMQCEHFFKMLVVTVLVDTSSDMCTAAFVDWTQHEAYTKIATQTNQENFMTHITKESEKYLDAYDRIDKVRAEKNAEAISKYHSKVDVSDDNTTLVEAYNELKSDKKDAYSTNFEVVTKGGIVDILQRKDISKMTFGEK